MSARIIHLAAERERRGIRVDLTDRCEACAPEPEPLSVLATIAALLAVAVLVLLGGGVAP